MENTSGKRDTLKKKEKESQKNKKSKKKDLRSSYLKEKEKRNGKVHGKRKGGLEGRVGEMWVPAERNKKNTLKGKEPRGLRRVVVSHRKGFTESDIEET